MPIFIVLFEHQPKFAKKWPPKHDNFSHFAKHRFIKKRFVATPPFDQQLVFFNLFFWNQKQWCWTKKHNLKSGKSKDERKDFKEKQDRKPPKKEKKFDEKESQFNIFMFSLHETKAKKKEQWKKTKARNTKKAKKKDTKEERKTRRKKERQEQERDRERETEKGGGQKRLREKKRETLKTDKKMPFLGGKQGFSIKTRKRKKQIRRV